jgi:hypothetical protein
MGAAFQSPPAEFVPVSKGTGVAQRVYAITEKAAIPLGAAISLVSFVRYAAYGSRRLWFDEIYSSTVALQPRWIDVWKAFAAAVDLQSPLFYALTRISWTLFGRDELALRIPEILGTLLFSWCLFFFVKKRFGPLFGLSSMILVLATDIEFFAADARPYGILLAAMGLAMLAWRNVIDNRPNRLALPLYAGSLALIVATHAYAVTVIAAFVIAEIARLIRTRKADWPLWACFLAILPPLAIYWFPFHAAKSAQGGVIGPAKAPHWEYFFGFYSYFFNDRLLFLFVLGVLLVSFALLRKEPKPQAPGMPAHEVVLAAALAAAPLYSIALAMLVTKYYLHRYSIYAMGGIVILAVVSIDALAIRRRQASALLLAASLLLFLQDLTQIDFSKNSAKRKDAEQAVPYSKVPPGVPLVIGSGMAMLPADVYSSDADLARTYYLTGREFCVKYTGSTIFEFGPPFTDYHHFRLHLEPYNEFVKTHRKFWVYGPYSYVDDWQVHKLQDDGARIVEKGRYPGLVNDNFLLEVELP